MTKILQLNSIINKNKNKKSWNNSTKREYENNHNDVQTCTINIVYCMEKKKILYQIYVLHTKLYLQYLL